MDELQDATADSIASELFGCALYSLKYLPYSIKLLLLIVIILHLHLMRVELHVTLVGLWQNVIESVR